MSDTLEDPRRLSFVLDGEEVINGGKCLNVTWAYLYEEMVRGGLAEEGDVLKQVDIHDTGVRLIVGPPVEKLKTEQVEES